MTKRKYEIRMLGMNAVWPLPLGYFTSFPPVLRMWPRALVCGLAEVLIWWESRRHFDKPLEVCRSHPVERQVYASGYRAVYSCVCTYTSHFKSDTAVFSTMLPRVKHKYVINCLFKTTPCLSVLFLTEWCMRVANRNTRIFPARFEVQCIVYSALCIRYRGKEGKKPTVSDGVEGLSYKLCMLKTCSTHSVNLCPSSASNNDSMVLGSATSLSYRFSRPI